MDEFETTQTQDALDEIENDTALIDEIEDDEDDEDNNVDMPVRRIFGAPYHYFYGGVLGYAFGSILSGILGSLGVLTDESALNIVMWGTFAVCAFIGHLLYKKAEKEWKAQKEQGL